MAVGLYISVPFCRTKCTYCNFASDVFSKSAFENYVRRVLEDVRDARGLASKLGSLLESEADSLYLGGGTPSILDATQLLRIFESVREQFAVAADAEITVECAPGTLTPSLIQALMLCGVNRVSLGVQSFVDQEARAVGRLHQRTTVLEEVARLREAGLENINIDLIAGLPHQSAESWKFSLAEAIALEVPHVSVYMLEVDEDSRLGRELIAGGTRYHAHFVPDDEMTADFYLEACQTLNDAGIEQYEISNFARHGRESQHNLKYWTRLPYIGFGVDAHSMLQCMPISAAETASVGDAEIATLKRCATEESSFRASANSCAAAVRFSTPDSLDAYMNRVSHSVSSVSTKGAIEESFFLGLRLNRGVDLDVLRARFGIEAVARFVPAIDDCVEDGLLVSDVKRIRLTPRGRLLSNEVFARFLGDEVKAGTGNVNPR